MIIKFIPIDKDKNETKEVIVEANRISIEHSTIERERKNVNFSDFYVPFELDYDKPITVLNLSEACEDYGTVFIVQNCHMYVMSKDGNTVDTKKF